MNWTTLEFHLAAAFIREFTSTQDSKLCSLLYLCNWHELTQTGGVVTMACCMYLTTTDRFSTHEHNQTKRSDCIISHYTERNRYRPSNTIVKKFSFASLFCWNIQTCTQLLVSAWLRSNNLLCSNRMWIVPTPTNGWTLDVCVPDNKIAKVICVSVHILIETTRMK